MRLLTPCSILVASSTLAVALPNPTSDNIGFSFNTSTTQLDGAAGVIQARFISTRSFAASLVFKDTKRDGHGVYMDITVYHRAGTEYGALRCYSGKGIGKELSCAEKRYTDGSTITAIVPRICVNTKKSGADECSLGPAAQNPYA